MRVMDDAPERTRMCLQRLFVFARYPPGRSNRKLPEHCYFSVSTVTHIGPFLPDSGLSGAIRR